MRPTKRTCELTLALASVALFAAADWTRFRGPEGAGIAESSSLPLKWSASENIAWKTALPGPGGSTPITLGDRIFLTCYTGYGVPDVAGDQANLKRMLVCLRLSDGKILWQKEEPAKTPENEYRRFQALHGYSSSTPATDGEAVYVFYGRTGVFAYDLDGGLLWKADVGDGTHGWGSATSPILFENLVIVNASVESNSVVALDKKTGKQVWRAGGIERSWSTPLVVELADGKKELVVSIEGKALGFDPATGEKLWECASIPDYTVPCVIAVGDVVYVTAGRQPATVAVRCGGRGDVTDTHRLWKANTGSKVPSPVCREGLLYWVEQKGIAACLDAGTGEVVYEKRLDIEGARDKVYASLVLGDGKLYCLSRQGETLVLAPGKELKILARNDLADGGIFNATPVIAGDQILIRSDKYLYCVGK